MKKLLVMALMLTTAVFASDDIDDALGAGNEEFYFEVYDQDEIFLAINKNIEISCKNGLCTLMRKSIKDRPKLTVKFSIGEGFNGQFGGFGAGGGVVILPNGEQSFDPNLNQDFWEASAQLEIGGGCDIDVQVPMGLYVSMQKYMYDLLSEGMETKEGFTPAEEAMIMFYTTIDQQSNNC